MIKTRTVVHCLSLFLSFYQSYLFHLCVITLPIYGITLGSLKHGKMFVTELRLGRFHTDETNLLEICKITQEKFNIN